MSSATNGKVFLWNTNMDVQSWKNSENFSNEEWYRVMGARSYKKFVRQTSSF